MRREAALCGFLQPSGQRHGQASGVSQVYSARAISPVPSACRHRKAARAPQMPHRMTADEAGSPRDQHRARPCVVHPGSSRCERRVRTALNANEVQSAVR